MNELNDIIEKERLKCDRKTLQEINDLLRINNKTKEEYIREYEKQHDFYDEQDKLNRVRIINEIFDWLEE